VAKKAKQSFSAKDTNGLSGSGTGRPEACGSRQAAGLEGSDPFGHRLKQRDDTSFLISIRAAILLTVKPGGFA
jgi:hypothetical protein